MSCEEGVDNLSTGHIKLKDKERGYFCFQSCQNHCRNKPQSLAICLKHTQINIIMQMNVTYGVCGLCHSNVFFGRFYGQTISLIPRIWGKNR